MEIKEYQKKVLDALSYFLDALSEERDSHDRLLNHEDKSVRELAKESDFVHAAWRKSTDNVSYYPQKDGLGNALPDVYIKVPTGGGKTLLACRAIDKIHSQYLHTQTGLVLWIVPTTQIYQQTLKSLSDRAHPYRQFLDISSANRTLIRRRGDILSPADIENNLVVLLMMLPATNRKNQAFLRMFMDSGGYAAFFPDDSDYDAHRKMLQEMPNLDAFDDDGGMQFPVVKSSLGNVIRLCRPLMLVDEGHKAKSELARSTLRGFNPAFILELSATPAENANIVATASGSDLNKEEMIKLDIHLKVSDSPDWKQTMLETFNKREKLEQTAEEYRQNGGGYIRPIALIQVERVSASTREQRHVHVEDVREWLMHQSGVRPDHIAVKSSETDDIEGIDLLSEECEIRYIITKYALQEGWDCSFAYVLAVLTNPTAQTSMMQLVGRILRQPGARKMKIKALDECYVFVRRQEAGDVISSVQNNLEKEGLGDLSGRLKTTSNGNLLDAEIREKFRRFDGCIYLPQFIVVQKNKVRLFDYTADILGNINWEQVCVCPEDLEKVVLENSPEGARSITIGLPGADTPQDTEQMDNMDMDPVFMARQLMDVVPNPWRAYEISRKILEFFVSRDGDQKAAADFIRIISESKRLLAARRDKLAEEVFNSLIEREILHFVLLTNGGYAWRAPSRIPLHSAEKLKHRNNREITRSLFDQEDAKAFNELEKDVALCLDNQEKLLWWYRNRVFADYSVQGWLKNRIYPDFITRKEEEHGGTVAVIETKGMHLKNDDTAYKEKIFKICESLTALDIKKSQIDWRKLGVNFVDQEFIFRVVHQDKWQSAINQIFS